MSLILTARAAGLPIVYTKTVSLELENVERKKILEKLFLDSQYYIIGEKCAAPKN